MMTRCRVPVLKPGLIGLAVLVMVLAVLAPARQRAAASVRLEYFKAEWQNASQTVVISWKTATELNTVGFIVRRSTLPGSGYVDITEMIPARGDQLAGGEYGVPPFDATNPRIADDPEDLLLSTTYWYRLVEIETDNSYHDDIGPVVAVLAGTETTITPTMTRTPTRTRTPIATTTTSSTATRTPTTTPTATPTSVLSTPDSWRMSWRMPSTTPIVAQGRTVTPAAQPPTSAAAAPANAVSANPIATPAPDAAIPNATTEESTDLPVATPPTGVNRAVPPTRAPTRLAIAAAPPVAMAPLVVATAGAPDAGRVAPAGNANLSVFVLIGAAGLLLLGGLYTILRQTQK
jgi:hypothetical protein